MPARKKAGARRRLQGKGFFDFIKNVVKKAAPVINDVLKSTKVASTIASKVNPTLGGVVASAGYGRRRRKARRGGAVVKF